jgi:hypothetical protein
MDMIEDQGGLMHAMELSVLELLARTESILA